MSFHRTIEMLMTMRSILDHQIRTARNYELDELYSDHQIRTARNNELDVLDEIYQSAGLSVRLTYGSLSQRRRSIWRLEREQHEDQRDLIDSLIVAHLFMLNNERNAGQARQTRVQSEPLDPSPSDCDSDRYEFPWRPALLLLGSLSAVWLPSAAPVNIRIRLSHRWTP